MISPIQTGYLTPDERKEMITFTSNRGFRFRCQRDLSNGITVECPYIAVGDLADAVAEFIGMWTVHVYKHLNGFAGFDCVPDFTITEI